MTTWRTALCGLGRIAWRFDRPSGREEVCLSHAGAYRRQERTRLVAGCSPETVDRDAFNQAFGLPAYDRLDTLLDLEHPDIVSICSPASVHFEQVMACLDSQVPMIWLEKPPTLTLAETDELIAKATGKGTVLVNYQRRYLPVYQELRRRFDARLLGGCRQIQATYSRGLEANGSHLLDLLFFVTGDGRDPRLQWVRTAGDRENPSFGLTIGEVEITVTGMALPYHNIDLTLTGEEGRLSVLHGGMTGVAERRIEHELFPGFHRLQTVEDKRFTGLAGLANGMENALLDLIGAHEGHRPPLSDLKSARRTMALIEEVRRWQEVGR